MIVPENPKALAELQARIKRNLEAGDWGPSSASSGTVFVPIMDEDEMVSKEDQLPDD